MGEADEVPSRIRVPRPNHTTLPVEGVAAESGHLRELAGGLPAKESALEVRHAIPHELDGDGEDEKAEDAIESADCAGTETPNQRST